MRIAAALAPLLLLCGCGALPFGSPPLARQVPEGLQLTAEPGTTAASAVTTLTLHNAAAVQIGQSLCFAALEQLRGGLWVPTVSVAKGCPEVIHPLEPGQQASVQSPLPPALVSDDYRFVTRVHVPLGSVPPEQLRSNRFAVVASGTE